MLFRLSHRSHALLAQFARCLPSSCALCGATQEESLCGACRLRFFSGARRHRCLQCATPLARQGDTRCGDCLKQAPAFDATIVAADYAPPLDQMVLALKFGGRLALASLMADLLRDAMLNAQSRQLPLPALMTAVPLGPQHLIERGFNQALEIAKPLARMTGIPLLPRLAFRVRDTQAQALLPMEERHRNLRHAFSVTPEFIHRIQGRHVAVADDVITTGATLNEMADTLKRFGAARVTNLVFARPPGE